MLPSPSPFCFLLPVWNRNRFNDPVWTFKVLDIFNLFWSEFGINNQIDFFLPTRALTKEDVHQKDSVQVFLHTLLYLYTAAESFSQTELAKALPDGSGLRHASKLQFQTLFCLLVTEGKKRYKIRAA